MQHIQHRVDKPILQHVMTLLAGLLLISACGSGQPVVPTEPEATAVVAAKSTSTSTPELATGPLSFEDSGQRLGIGRSRDVSIGDLDGDDDLDAFVANGILGEVGSALWQNDGQGIFTIKEQELGHGNGLELGDLDGDGDLDVFIVGWVEVGRVWLNDGSGIFLDSEQSLGSVGGWDVALGDIDGDGDLDAYIAHENEDTVWLNDGSGIFSDTGQRIGTTYTTAAGLGDVDGDGDLDAVTAGWGEPARVWLNDGSGSFTDSGQTLTPGFIHIHGMILGDVTGDGVLDAIMTGAPNQVWFNDGSGMFIDSEQSLSKFPTDTVALKDLDGDGDLDAYLAVGTSGRAQDEIWLNDGQGQFVESEIPLSTGFSSGIGLGDLDGDGDIDAFITHGELGLAYDGGLPNEVWLNMMRYRP